FLTMHQDATWAARAFDLGASGFVLKHSATGELVTAIRETLAGRTYVPPALAREVIQVFRGGPSGHTGSGRESGARRGAGVELTPRQREVLQLFAEGHSAKEVARILKISPRTAEFHKASVMKSLGLHSIAELTRYAVRHGLVTS
ncbi:MAG: response regulator transcription factor, partial [Planctomycetia bacterium]|nr:response regulator transcription factor [Planctomycetia bacterium]